MFSTKAIPKFAGSKLFSHLKMSVLRIYSAKFGLFKRTSAVAVVTILGFLLESIVVLKDSNCYSDEARESTEAENLQ